MELHNDERIPTMNPDSPCPITDRTVGRRTMLSGALAVSAGAILAACGEQGDTGLARVGEAPTTTALPAGTVTDEVLVRTLTALEYNILDGYERLLAAGHVTDDAAVFTLRSLALSHRTLAVRIGARAATPVTSKSERIDSLYITPALEAVASSTDKAADALALAHALECLGASTYQAFVAWAVDPSLRASLVGYGSTEAAQAVDLALTIRPGIAGVFPETSEDGTVVISPAAVPSAFGSLAGVDVELGAPSETGTRDVFTFETPSLNTLEYLD